MSFIYFLLSLKTLMPPEEDSGVTGEKEIANLIMQINKSKLMISFILCLMNLPQEAHRFDNNVFCE